MISICSPTLPHEAVILIYSNVPYNPDRKGKNDMATLAVGESAPDFEALTDQNTLTKLSDYRGQRVVLYFYPKDDTSG